MPLFQKIAYRNSDTLLTDLGCDSKMDLKQYKFIFSQFWKLKIFYQGGETPL